MKSMHGFQRVVAFVSVLQTAGQFSSLLTAKMPTLVLQIYDVMDIFLGDYDIVKVDCLGHKPPFAVKFLGNIVYNFLIGAFMSFGTVLVGQVRQRIDSARREHWREFYADRFRCTLTVWAQLTYVNLTRRAFEAMYCVPRGDGTFHLEHFPTQRCFTGVHIALLLIASLTVCLMTLGWPLLYTRFLRSKTEATLCEDERFRHRHPHIVLLKPTRRLFFLWSYASGVCLAIAEVFAATHPESRVAIGGTAIFAHIAAVFRLSPHVVSRDDWVLISYEFPMLMLLGIGAAAELGTVSDRTLTILSLFTLALLAGCVVFHLGDLVYHVVRDEAKDNMLSDLGGCKKVDDDSTYSDSGSSESDDDSPSSLDEATISVKVERYGERDADGSDQPGVESDRANDDGAIVKPEGVPADDGPVNEEETVGFLASIWNMLPILSARAVFTRAPEPDVETEAEPEAEPKAEQEMEPLTSPDESA
jgi:hypothetical protein